MKKEFVQAIFCAPTGAYEDKPYPSRLTDEVFDTLAKTGINRIFGFGYDGRKETVEKTFELCDKYGISYFPTPASAEDYVRILPGKNGEKPFCELTEAEKEELDSQFAKELEDYAKYKSFGGIFFSDEAGYLAAEGIASAKKVFDKQYGKYEFHTNFYSYSIDDKIFWGGMGGMAPEKLPFSLTGDMEIRFENRFRYYDCLVENLLSKAPFEYVSQDKYPYEMFWPTVPTSVHVALFELTAYFNEKKKKYGSKFYNYMQVGNWGSDKREITFADMALQMHVTAAYGSEGFAYFPGCFPLDYVSEPSFAGSRGSLGALIDIDGNPTIYCDYVRRLNTFFHQIEDDILNSELLGVNAYGTYDNGFTEDEVKDLPDNECIFRGKLPDRLLYDSNLPVKSSNEVLLSVFQKEEKRRYYLVNLSTVFRNNVKIELPEGQYELIGLEGRRKIQSRESLFLGAGCGVYIREL